MSTEDSQSVVGNILEDLVNMEMPARFHNTDWAEYAIEAYVTTRVKEALEHSVSNIKEEIKASQENLNYQRNKTNNAKLANEWHCTIMGEQWCLRALKKQLKALTTTTNGKEE